jgi:hypothetical protein
MSNIHTLRDIEQQENATPLPNTWASSRNEPTVESYRPSGHYRIGFVPQVGGIRLLKNHRNERDILLLFSLVALSSDVFSIRIFKEKTQ